jgi:hypothetical protein
MTKTAGTEPQRQVWLDRGALLIAVLGLALTWCQSRATQRSVDAQVRSSELHDRPWLSISAFAGPRLDGSAGDHAVWEIANVGPIPATRVYYSPFSRVKTGALVDGDLTPPSEEHQPQLTAVPAGQPVQFTSEIDWTPEMIAAVKSGRATAWLCFHIKYYGADEKAHVLRMCQKYNPARATWDIFPPPSLQGDVL